MSSIRRLAIVNRGGPAMRCLAAAAELGRGTGGPITTIAVYAEPDAASWFVREADEAVPLPPAAAGPGGYADPARLMPALAAARADAVWPGWDLAAGTAELAAECEDAGIAFAGPPSGVLRLLGDPVRARQLAQDAGVPALPGAEAAGAGQRAGARCVGVPVLADGHGTVWALGACDRSIGWPGRRLIEESGCTALEPATHDRLREAALRLCRAAGYRGAGTVEFLLDPGTQRFQFTGVCAELSPGHPVTEMTTGLDLVGLQLHIAGGGRLPAVPPAARGHAIAAALTAEDPERGFAPAPGRVAALRLPAGPGLRADCGVTQGDEVAAAADPVIATVVAWGADRDEALGRLRRGLARSLVVIDGGATNKALLLRLADGPDMRAGSYDTAWAGRLTAAGGYRQPPDPVALLAAAIEAAEADQAVVRANFLAAAARGRPALPATAGHRIRLRADGGSYQMHVRALGRGDYRVATGEGQADVNVARLGRYERAVTCAGRRYRVTADTQGSRLLIEVDGVPHVITRDDGGQVRCPSPAFVVAVLVRPGDTVRAGDPLAVVESMKMESTITAPQAGTITSVPVQANTQVEAGTPVARLQVAAEREPGPGTPAGAEGQRASFAGLTGTGGADDSGRMLRAYLLGYDLEDGQARELTRSLGARQAAVPPDDPGLLRDEQELLEIFADAAALSRRVHEDDEEDAHAQSPQEYLHTYLAFLDVERSAVPDSFAAELRAALAHYGVRSLARSPELEQAVTRIYRSVGRLRAAAPIAIGILGRWRRAAAVLAPAMTDERLAVLAQLADSTHGRCPEVCDLARDVRFSYVDAPLLAQTRAQAYAQIEASLRELSAPATADGRQAAVNRIVWFPLPMRATLRDRFREADDTTRPLLLEARTRRFYRIRGLTGLRCERFGRYLTCLADYTDPGPQAAPVHLVTAYVPVTELPAFAAALTGHLDRLGAGRRVVVDVESWRDGPLLAEEQMSAELSGLLAATDFGRDLDRLTVTVTSATGPAGQVGENLRTQAFTYRSADGGFAEDLLYRNMHPMIAERLDLRQFANFTLRRLPSAEDVYLFHAVAHANPKDERLIALAEVRDLTAARDSAGTVLGYPHLEGMLTQALAEIRRALGGQPPRKRPLSNRVVLYVRPPWDIPADTLRGVAHRLAPLAADLGLEKVAVRVRVPDELTDEPAEAVLDVENMEDRAVTVRFGRPAAGPIEPLTEYRQKVLRAQRLGMPYPYEIIRMLTPPPGVPADFPAGEFTEYDLRGDGAMGNGDGADELVPVDRPYGGNKAGIITGVITSFTPLVPEGMRRVAILGDPTAGLGNLAEAECRRILAALNLAARLRLPVEWFALSSGARIAWDSGTENMDWVAAVLRRLIEFTQAGGEVNIVVTGINVGAQPYWNAEATMLMHTRGILIMTPASAMVLTGKASLDYSGGMSAEDNFGIGGFERIMGPNGQAQYWAPSLAAACALLLRHYAHSYIVPGEGHPRRAPTADPADRDVCASPHPRIPGSDFTAVGDVFSAELNGERKKPFDMRSVMRAVTDSDHEPFERWARWRDAEGVIVWDARVGGFGVCLIGLESRTVPRSGLVPADGPPAWTSGTLFPQGSRKLARAVNAASGNRPVVVLANLAGFDGSPESLRKWQLEYGAEIGRAVTNFRGPIVFVVVSRYHGGAFVVFSKRLHEEMDTAAVTGSFASVIGGAPAAAVVLAREVSARTEKDPRVVSQRERAGQEAAPAAGTGDGHALADAHRQLAEVITAVRAEKLREVADEFDGVHDIKRAMRVGSVDHIIAPAELRPFIIDALERRLAGSGPA